LSLAALGRKRQLMFPEGERNPGRRADDSAEAEAAQHATDATARTIVERRVTAHRLRR
jgi:hypothetical protein